MDAFENDLSIHKIGYIKNVQGISNGIDYLDNLLYKKDFLSKMEKNPQSEWKKPAKRLYDLLKPSNFEDNGIICIYKFKK